MCGGGRGRFISDKVLLEFYFPLIPVYGSMKANEFAILLNTLVSFRGNEVTFSCNLSVN